MTTKTLFVFVASNGDGSFSSLFTFDKDLVEKLNLAHKRGLTNADGDPGVDGDGFQYSELTLPETVTRESLGHVRWLEDHWHVQQALEALDSGSGPSM